jgi:hypothetical protein
MPPRRFSAKALKRLPVYRNKKRHFTWKSTIFHYHRLRHGHVSLNKTKRTWRKHLHADLTSLTVDSEATNLGCQVGRRKTKDGRAV